MMTSSLIKLIGWKMKSSRWIVVSEIAGALGVIATLIFVGTEIQQNTEAIRTSTVQAIADQDTTITLTYATDDRIADLIALIRRDPDAYKDESKMSAADRLRLEMIFRSTLRRVENIHLHVQAGVLEPQALDRVGYGWYQTAFVQDYWERAQDGFDAGFVKFMSSKIADK